MKLRVAAGIVLLWTLVGVVSGAQQALAGRIQGEPQPLGPAITGSLYQALPWIPATLLAVALAVWWPLGRRALARSLAVHVVGVLASAWSVNVLLVLGWWWQQGAWKGVSLLARQAVVWGVSRLALTVLVYGTAVAVTQGVAYSRTMRRRELQLVRLEAQLAQARLQVLNAQIRPHFLFNTLHTIGQLWRAGRAEEADALLDHLGSLFQRVIASTDRGSVPLSEELAMVRDYLAIEQVRLGDRLTSRIQADDGALLCLVPPLILQPLVENAVKHGVAAAVAGGDVAVLASRDGEQLVLSVSDASRGAVRPGEPAGTGTGLANVQERLKSLYGDRQSLVLTRRDGTGTDVRLTLPVAEADA